MTDTTMKIYILSDGWGIIGYYNSKELARQYAAHKHIPDGYYDIEAVDLVTEPPEEDE